MTLHGRAVLLAPFLVALSAGVARSEAPDARAEYDRGKRAYDAGIYETAAEAFAAADALVPNPSVLVLALDATVRADDPVLGMTLVTRGEARPVVAKLASALQDARVKFRGRVARIDVGCDKCTVAIDGTAARVAEGRWVTPGHHLVDLTIADRVEHHPVDVAPGGVVSVQPDPPPVASRPASEPPFVSASAHDAPPVATRPPPLADTTPRPSPHSDALLSPVWFAFGAGLTAVLGGATIASGLDTIHKHDAFTANPSGSGQSDGRAAQTRTNVLLGATGFVALSTVAMGIFFVQWSRGPQGPTALVFVNGAGGGFRLSY